MMSDLMPLEDVMKPHLNALGHNRNASHGFASSLKRIAIDPGVCSRRWSFHAYVALTGRNSGQCEQI